MKIFVFWTGIISIFTGLALALPWLWEKAGLNIPDSNIWLFFPATFVVIIGIILVLCSRDLNSRASIVYWVGICKLIAPSLIAGFFFKDFGPMIFGFSIIEWAFALVYFIGLPKSLNASFFDILFDKYSGR